jgi:disintegrin and metalloproteinase domain-containing protein 10
MSYELSFFFVTGTTPECPDPKPRDDKTKCNNGTQLCINGECAGSICLLWNMSECFLTSQIIPNIDKRKLCELACQNLNDTSTCRSTSEFAHLFDLPQGGINLRPGSPCDNFQVRIFLFKVLIIAHHTTKRLFEEL